MANVTDFYKELAQEAMNNIYGNGYVVSSHDIEMMIEFMELVNKRKNDIRNAEMLEASEKRGIEW